MRLRVFNIRLCPSKPSTVITFLCYYIIYVHLIYFTSERRLVSRFICPICTFTYTSLVSLHGQIQVMNSQKTSLRLLPTFLILAELPEVLSEKGNEGLWKDHQFVGAFITFSVALLLVLLQVLLEICFSNRSSGRWFKPFVSLIVALMFGLAITSAVVMWLGHAEKTEDANEREV